MCAVRMRRERASHPHPPLSPHPGSSLRAVAARVGALSPRSVLEGEGGGSTMRIIDDAAKEGEQEEEERREAAPRCIFHQLTAVHDDL